MFHTPVGGYHSIWLQFYSHPKIETRFIFILDFEFIPFHSHNAFDMALSLWSFSTWNGLHKKEAAANTRTFAHGQKLWENCIFSRVPTTAEWYHNVYMTFKRYFAKSLSVYACRSPLQRRALRPQCCCCSFFWLYAYFFVFFYGMFWLCVLLPYCSVVARSLIQLFATIITYGGVRARALVFLCV